MSFFENHIKNAEFRVYFHITYWLEGERVILYILFSQWKEII